MYLIEYLYKLLLAAMQTSFAGTHIPSKRGQSLVQPSLRHLCLPTRLRKGADSPSLSNTSYQFAIIHPLLHCFQSFAFKSLLYQLQIA